jgi:hypothetical protein
MSVKYENKWFSKRGKGVPQVELKGENGKPLMEDGKPVIGNEQFEVKQLTTDSIDGSSADTLMTDIVEASGGDLKVAAIAYRMGWNEYTKGLAGGSDEATKSARMLYKAGFNFGFADVNDLAIALREGRLKVA